MANTKFKIVERVYKDHPYDIYYYSYYKKGIFDSWSFLNVSLNKQTIETEIKTLQDSWKKMPYTEKTILING